MSGEGPNPMDTAIIGTDDLGIIETLGAEIQALGYETVCAANGLEVIEAVGRKCPSVVFLDASILVVSAYACCRELRQDPTVPKSLPIFLLTDNETSPRILARFGFTGIFPKRHGFENLREFLARKV
jgi:CheY-like chemotaxis protein